MLSHVTGEMRARVLLENMGSWQQNGPMFCCLFSCRAWALPWEGAPRSKEHKRGCKPSVAITRGLLRLQVWRWPAAVFPAYQLKAGVLPRAAGS